MAAITAPVDSPVVLKFVNETVRPTADRLAGLLPLLNQIVDAEKGQNLSPLLGTDDATLWRSFAQPWLDADYGATGFPPQPIVGSDSGGRTLLTHYDLIGFFRVIAAVKALADSNASLGPLVGKLAVNPRA